LTSDDKQDNLAQYRLRQAEESLEEARFLLEGKKSARSIINRVYYAMFYSVLALLVYEPYSSSKHSGVLSYFNKRFIKEKIFHENLGRAITKAFELRQRSDYREYCDLNYDQVVPLITEAEKFIQSVKAFLQQKLKKRSV
jgi:uncharacterized protein (UPF0332 family)